MDDCYTKFISLFPNGTRDANNILLDQSAVSDRAPRLQALKDSEVRSSEAQ
jgi:hypothetical protein